MKIRFETMKRGSRNRPGCRSASLAWLSRAGYVRPVTMNYDGWRFKRELKIAITRDICCIWYEVEEGK
jgi:hypothetical protein